MQRRHLLTAIGAGSAVFAGCLGGDGDDSSPEEDDADGDQGDADGEANDTRSTGDDTGDEEGDDPEDENPCPNTFEWRHHPRPRQATIAEDLVVIIEEVRFKEDVIEQYVTALDYETGSRQWEFHDTNKYVYFAELFVDDAIYVVERNDVFGGRTRKVGAEGDVL